MNIAKLPENFVKLLGARDFKICAEINFLQHLALRSFFILPF